MKLETIAAIITCIISCGGVLVFIGRSLGTLSAINDAVQVALRKTDEHEKEISAIKVELTEVRTRQEDCDRCP